MSAPTPESLLEHVGFLRAIALGLLRNEADAEDVVQQTLVAAMERPPADDRNLRGWLAAVTRNLAFMQFRSQRRRREREARVARADGAPSAARIAARMEMERRVVDAVSTLDEPFRTAVILRYYDGLSPKEIAAKLDLPAATVRTRLKRGLDRMRGDLEAKSGGRRPMIAGLLLLAQLPVRAASAWSLRVAAAGAVAAVVFLGVAVTWLVEQQRTEPPTTRMKTARADRTKPPPAGADPAARPPSRARPEHRVSGRVVDGNGAPLPGTEVLVIPHEGPGRLETPVRRTRRLLEPPAVIERTTADGAGRYELPLDGTSPVWIVARRPGHAIDAFPLLDSSGSYEGADLQLVETEGTRGVVVDQSGAAIAGATVHGWDPRFDDEFFPALISCRTSPAGEFALPIDPVPLWDRGGTRVPVTLVVDLRPVGSSPRLLPFFPKSQVEIRLDRGPAVELPLPLEVPTTVALFGREAGVVRVIDLQSGERKIRFRDVAEKNDLLVLQEGREPILASLLVPRINEPRVSPGLDEARPRILEGRVAHPGAEVGYALGELARDRMLFGVDCLEVAVADDRGRFRLANPGTGMLVAAPHLAPILSPHVTDPLPAATATGVVTDGTGEPVAGARVTAVPQVRNPLFTPYYRRQAGNWTTLTRRDGRFVLGHLPPHELEAFRIVAVHPGRGLWTESDHSADTLRMTEQREIPLRIVASLPKRAVPDLPEAHRTQHHVEGFVVSHEVAGGYVDGARVSLEDRPGESAVTDSGGRFRIPVPEGWDVEYVLIARKPGVGEGRFPGVRANRTVSLQIPHWEEFAGRLTYRGSVVTGAYVRSFVGGRLVEEAHTDDGGRFRFQCTPFTREFSISIAHPEFQGRWIDEPAEGDLELERAVPLRVRVLNEHGNPVPGVVVLIGKQRRRSDLDGNVDLRRETEEPPAIALARAGQDWIAAGPVTWSDDEAVATLRIRRGLRIRGEVRDRADRPLAGVLVLAEPVVGGSPPRRAFTNSQGRYVVRGLEPGRHRVRVSGAEESVEVEAGASDVELRGEKK